MIKTAQTAGRYNVKRDSYANYINSTSAAVDPKDVANPIQEKLFVVENISFPQNRKININSGENPTYRDAGKINLSITPHAHLSTLVGYEFF